MENNQSGNVTNTHILIQVNGEKTARIQCTLSKTVAELRKILSCEKIPLPKNAEFLDAQGYPVSLSVEELLQINVLIIPNNDDNIIHLRVIKTSTNVDDQRSNKKFVRVLVIILTILGSIYYVSDENNRRLLVNNQLCPLFIKLNSPKLMYQFECSANENGDESDTYINTKTYLGDQIKEKSDGTEVLVNTKKGLKKVETKVYNEYYMGMINDWVRNRDAYKKDYEWYNTMRSTSGNCAGKFDERVIFSAKRIKNTSSSIELFTTNAFESWPQALISRIDIENQLDGIDNEDGGGTEFENNGKISDNMYLVAWKREDDTIRIQTYVVIFERTAGDNCKFTEEYWSGQREKVHNAKKYFLLQKIESNPVYKEFLIRQSTHQQIG